MWRQISYVDGSNILQEHTQVTQLQIFLTKAIYILHYASSSSWEVAILKYLLCLSAGIQCLVDTCNLFTFLLNWLNLQLSWLTNDIERLRLNFMTNNRLTKIEKSASTAYYLAEDAEQQILLWSVGLIAYMITANEKILGKEDGSQKVHHEVFSSHLVNHRILLQSSARWQVWGAERSYLHKHWFLNKCLLQRRQNMEKRDSEIFIQSPGRQYITSKAFITPKTLF